MRTRNPRTKTYIMAGLIGLAVFIGFQIGIPQFMLALLLPALFLTFPLWIVATIVCLIVGFNPFRWVRDKMNGTDTRPSRTGTELVTGYNPTTPGIAPTPFVAPAPVVDAGHPHPHLGLQDRGYVDPLNPHLSPPSATSWHGDDALAHEFGFTEADIPRAEMLDLDGEDYW